MSDNRGGAAQPNPYCVTWSSRARPRSSTPNPAAIDRPPGMCHCGEATASCESPAYRTLAPFGPRAASPRTCPDPISIRRHERVPLPAAGWIVLHVEGRRGHDATSTAAATEIAVRRFAAKAQKPVGGLGTCAPAIESSQRKFDRDNGGDARHRRRRRRPGARSTAGGATTDRHRRTQCWAEIEAWTADWSTPSAWRDEIPGRSRRPMPAKMTDHCSANATTADGKIVFGHITMFGASRLYNSGWTSSRTLAPVLMQSCQRHPGGLLPERCRPHRHRNHHRPNAFQRRRYSAGEPIRKAQFGGHRDVVKVEGEQRSVHEQWLLADTRQTRSRCSRLGTKATRLWRSSKANGSAARKGSTGDATTPGPAGRLAIVDVRDRRTQTPGSWAADRKWLGFTPSTKEKITVEAGRRHSPRRPSAWPTRRTRRSTAEVTTTQDPRTFGPPSACGNKPIGKLDYPVIPLVANDWTVTRPRAGGITKVADWPERTRPFHSPSLPKRTADDQARLARHALANRMLPAAADRGLCRVRRIVALS